MYIYKLKQGLSFQHLTPKTLSTLRLLLLISFTNIFANIYIYVCIYIYIYRERERERE